MKYYIKYRCSSWEKDEWDNLILDLNTLRCKYSDIFSKNKEQNTFSLQTARYCCILVKHQMRNISIVFTNIFSVGETKD